MQKIQTVCLIALTTIAIGVSLALLRTVLLPFVVAVFIVIGSRPVLGFFENRLKLSRYVAYAATFMLGFLGFLAFGALVWVSFADLANNAGAYEQRLDTIAAWILERMPEERGEGQTPDDEAESLEQDGATATAQPPVASAAPATSAESAVTDAETKEDSVASSSQSATDPVASPGEPESMGLTAADLADAAIAPAGSESALDGDADEAELRLGMGLTPTAREPLSFEPVPNLTDSPTQAMQRFLKFGATYIQSQLLNLASGLSVLLSNGILILIFSFFLLLGSGEANKGGGVPQQGTSIAHEVEQQVRKYLVMKTVISFLTGLAFGLVLWLFGVPLAILFGFSAFLLNFIPNIGPLVASALPIPFLILNSTISPVAGMICFVLCVVVQFVSGNIIEPRLMGKSFDVSPTFLLVALMFFGLIWGIVGMFLATPLVSILKIILEKTEMGRPVAELMAGRWDPQTEPS